MGALAFLPWMTVQEPVQIGAFRLLPIVLDQYGKRECDPSQAWKDPPAQVVRILKRYWDSPHLKTVKEPQGGTISSATVVQFQDQPIADDLDDSEIEGLFSLREAVTFSGLAEREFFARGRDYFNRDSFVLVAQRVQGRTGGLFEEREGKEPGRWGSARRERAGPGGECSLGLALADVLRVEEAMLDEEQGP